MNFDYAFPLFESLMHGSLNPMLPQNNVGVDYDLRLQDTIISTATDNGMYSMRFLKAFNLKCRYYQQKLLSETYLYVQDLEEYLNAEEDSNIRSYLCDIILTKHLGTCLARLNERMVSEQLSISKLYSSTPSDSAEYLSNIYVFQLLKVCIAKSYLEVQALLQDVVPVKMNEEMLYTHFFGETNPVHLFLTKQKRKKPEIPYSAPASEKAVAAEPPTPPLPPVVAVVHDYCTVEDMASILKVNERTVRRKLVAGEIKGLKLGAKWLVEKSDLEIYLNSIDNKQSNKNKILHDDKC